MAGGYSAQPKNGFEKIVAELNDLKRRVDALATAAPLRNAAITGGNGMTVGSSPKIRVYDDTASSTGVIAFTSASDASRGGAIRSDPSPVIGYVLITSPGDLSNLNVLDPKQSSISLASKSDTGIGPSLTLAAGGGNIQVWDNDGVNATANVIVQNFFLSRLASGDQQIQSNQASLVFPFGVTEARIRDAANSAYVPIRASAFTVSSTAAVKERIADLGWSPLDVVTAAKAKRWHYRPDHADPARVHVGPMAEDLPAELVDTTSEVPALDLGVLVGVLWGAVQELAAQVRDLQQPQRRPSHQG